MRNAELDQKDLIARVVFNLPIDRAFDYAVPEAMRARLAPGARVLAPFGPRKLVGYVQELASASRVAQPRALLALLDEAPSLTSERMRLAEWMRRYYGCSLGEACASIVPAGLRFRPETHEPVSPGVAGERPPTLTAEQQRAFEALQEGAASGRFGVFLLHGVTGSGKTEVYLRLIGDALDRGRSAIALVPEIALTPQAIDRFRARFGEEVVLWHSRLTERQRAIAWQEMAAGRRRIVVGTRSAVFAPMAHLGCLILDEEHDTSYKQDETPRYHAREVACARARRERALVVLGSATPSIESYHLATTGRTRLLELPHRIHKRPLPRVMCVDMRQSYGPRRRGGLLSPPLGRALERVVAQQEQAILLLNRRGFARVLQCPACGLVVRCSRCSVPLIYHASPPEMRCHYCSLRREAPEMCPSCGKGYVRSRGFGTEKVESELHRLFPGSGIARMDADTTRRRGSHRALYDALTSRQIGLLVGTQMVAKGLDLPQVTLIGVVSADTSLNLPDFRSGERTFDLLTQVAGRAGRGERPGEVIIQTYCPEHYAIRAACRHDYRAFFREELAMRRRQRLPPFAHLIELTVQGRTEARVEAASQELSRRMRAALTRRRVTLLGPAPHRIATIRRTVRWRLVLVTAAVEPVIACVRRVIGQSRRISGLPVLIDVDPL